MKESTRRLLDHHFLARFPRVQRLLGIVRGREKRWEGKSTEEIFTTFYDEHLWRCDESVSGKGSTVDGTEALRDALPGLFEELGARSILDAPCGDMNWIQAVDWDLDSYIGGDIVATLIDRLSCEHSDGKTSFVQLDITRDPLPAADVFFCRDCFIHLTNDQVLDALRNAARSECRYLMTNTFPSIGVNERSHTGGLRRLDLRKPPFNLGAPIQLIEDRVDRPGFKYMGVWSRDQLQRLLV